jgi:hypothetical protein
MEKDIEQIKQLIKPVMNEDRRLEAVINSAGEELSAMKIKRPNTPDEEALQNEREKLAH